jgi:hypothetical protein
MRTWTLPGVDGARAARVALESTGKSVSARAARPVSDRGGFAVEARVDACARETLEATANDIEALAIMRALAANLIHD